MSSITLKATERTKTGKGANRGLRSQGLIPAVLYGMNTSKMLTMHAKDVRHDMADLTGLHELVTLRIEDEQGNQIEEHRTLVQEIQMHPYRDEIIHVDFRVLDPQRKVFLKVPLRPVGNSPGVKLGGVLQMIQRTVPIACTPENIPEFLEVDVSNLNMKETVRVMDVSYPENVSPRARQNYSVVGVFGRVKRA